MSKTWKSVKCQLVIPLISNQQLFLSDFEKSVVPKNQLLNFKKITCFL